MATIDEIVNKIRISASNEKTIFIAIDGRGGSGKSTLAEKLQEALQNVTIIHFDDIVYPMGGADRQRLLEQVIIPLKNNKKGKYQIYDHIQQKFTIWKEVQPEGIVIIEGVSTLHDDLYKYFDYKIWIECPAELGLKRGTAREFAERKVDTTKEWVEKYLPEEKKYVDEQKPQTKADYIIDGTKELV